MNDQEMIEAITKELNALNGPPVPRRQEGDVDTQQLAAAWDLSEQQAARYMKRVSDNQDKTGFEMLKVYDPNRKHLINVLRKVVR